MRMNFSNEARDSFSLVESPYIVVLFKGIKDALIILMTSAESAQRRGGSGGIAPPDYRCAEQIAEHRTVGSSSGGAHSTRFLPRFFAE